MAAQDPIAIVSLADDPHARVVRGLIQRDFGRRCEIVAVDRIADSGALHWADGPRANSVLPALHGGEVAVRDLAAVWWRRGGARALVPERVREPAAVDQITDDCNDALVGVMRADFRGAWVSHPDATRASESKLLQLRLAREVALRVPRTLVSQRPAEIRAFFDACEGEVVVKPLTTRLGAGVAAGRLTRALLQQDDVLRLSPAIYQELVPGRHHLRVHVLGEQALAALIDAEDLDWRFNLRQTRLAEHALDDSLRAALADLLVRLGLRMGVFDLKLAADGEPLWLEVNPQGQFLFVEGLCGLPLSHAMATFLVAEAGGADEACTARPASLREPCLAGH